MSTRSSFLDKPSLGNTIAQIKECDHRWTALFTILGVAAAVAVVFASKAIIDLTPAAGNNPNVKYLLFLPVAGVAMFSGECFYHAGFYGLRLKGKQSIDVLNKDQFVQLLNKPLKEAARERYENQSLTGNYDYPRFGARPQVGVAQLGEAHEATKGNAFTIMENYQQSLCNWWDVQEKLSIIQKVQKNPEQYLRGHDKAIIDIANAQIDINALQKKATQRLPTSTLRGEGGRLTDLQMQIEEANRQLESRKREQEALIDQYKTPLEVQQRNALANIQVFETQWLALQQSSLDRMESLA